MDPLILLVLAIGTLLVLLLTGLPVFICFSVISVGGLLLFVGPAGFGMVVNSIFDTTTTAALATIPAFLLMGEVLFRSGSGGVLFDSVDKLIGRLRGRQYILSIVLSTILGALSGAAMAVAAMLGRALLTDMEKRGYDRGMSCGTILAGASLAPIIPPSVLAIIAGTLANVSIAKLLVAGIVPGVMLATIFFVYVLLRVRLNPKLAPRDADLVSGLGWRERSMALLRLVPFTGIIFMVMGLILLGVATPSEAAATGVLGAIFTAAIFRRLSFALIRESLISTAKMTSMILVIMAAATFYSQLLSITGSMSSLTEEIAKSGLDRWAMFALMLFVPFVLCMLLDQIAVMLVVIPVFAPLVTSLGFDPIWFWAIFVINISIGGITPPFGYTMFVLQATAPHIPLTEIYRAAWPFVFMFALGILILVLVPQLVTLLPKLM